MKKIFVILMTICLMVSVFSVASITAFAAEETLPEPAAGTVLRVTAIKGDETVLVGDYTNFEEGWREAIKEARPSRMKFNKYERVIVDLCTDWISAEDGNFTDDKWMQGNSFGFNNDTIYIQDDVKITLNLNGHTIKRVLPDSQSDGEVIYIDEDADVIINNGTITGGKSTNGAGGIHIHDAHVTLNDVHIVGNVADNDDGGGIALYDDAVLVMNGGSFRDNSIDGVVGNELFDCYGGAIYIEDSTATFNGVEFKNNQNTNDEDYGAAIYADNSKVYLYECTFDGNGIEDESKKTCGTTSIVHAEDSDLVMEKVTFVNNGSYYDDDYIGRIYASSGLLSSLIVLDDSTFTLSGDSKFTNNATVFAISVYDDSHLYVENTTFENNKSFVMYSRGEHYDDSYFKNCTFENNKVPDAENLFKEIDDDWIYTFAVDEEVLTFIDCKMSDSTYYDRDNMKFTDTDAANGAASIFGEGSLTNILVIISLIASGVSIFLTVYYNKKKAAPVAVDAKETEDEE